MTIDTESLVSITEANQNFSRVARMVDERGTVVVMKNNMPKYLIIDFAAAMEDAEYPEQHVEEYAAQVVEENREAYEDLMPVELL